jgi:predicted PhzF superfamily epimerase YddE/YHI9
VHVVVAPSSTPGVTFESRMFAPRAGVPEDPVSGSAHSLSTPYWMVTNNIPESEVILAEQVSARGGDLRIVLDGREGRIKLAGAERRVVHLIGVMT